MIERSRFKRFVIVLVSFWIGTFVFVPNLMMVVVSFLERHPVSLVSWRLSPAGYLGLLEPTFFTIFLRSFGYALATTGICLILGYPFAWLLARHPKSRRNLLLVLVIIPFWTSSLIRTYALIILLKANGLLNTWFLALGLIEAPLDLLYTDAAVHIGLVYALLPFMILPLYAAMEKLDERLVEAAVDLGANLFQIFSRVIVPLTLPGIIAGCILVFLPAMGLFYIPDLLGGAKTMLLGNFIKNQFLTAHNWPFGSAASVVLTLLMGPFLYGYYLALKRFNISLIQ